MTDHRFIDESFPVKEVSAEAARDKSIRHGHISTLHIWWARRPLAASRATTYAALLPAPANIDAWHKTRGFIMDLCKWESSLSHTVIQQAREQIQRANNGQPPRVLDPFAGGGSYPLEALRLGCETYAGDYNPVAVLILKATLEYPQRFARPVVTSTKQSGQLSFAEMQEVNPLLDAVKRWSAWVSIEARKELDAMYPLDKDGAAPIGYMWARAVPCQNPACQATIPLLRQFWIVKKEKRKIALHPVVSRNTVAFELVGDGYAVWPAAFDPSRGTVAGAVVTCPCCGSVMDDKTTRRLFQERRASERMIAVILEYPGRSGKRYRIATPDDMRVFGQAQYVLEQKRSELMLEWGLDPVPDEPLAFMSGVFNVPLYGMDTWGSLFNSRQQLALVVFADKVRQVYGQLIDEGQSPEFAVAVSTYLAITFDRLADKNSNLVIYHTLAEKIEHVFGRQALAMIWDYVEINPFTDVGWPNMQRWVELVLKHLSAIPPVRACEDTTATREQDAPITSDFQTTGHRSSERVFIPVVTECSATSLPYPDGYFDAVLTDPPYYNSVPYADLSDFFYVWLKRTIGHLHPELFATVLSPKDKEITEMAGWDPRRYANKDKAFFEEGLRQAFREVYRVLKPGGVSVLVYAHKSTAGWETVINALLDSGLIVSAAWPINTELQSGLRAGEAAALASSIYIVGHKWPRQPVGFYNEVRDEVRRHLDAKLQRLWEEGIGGADFFIAAIGSAIEVFGKYEQVLDYEGNVVRADRLLEDVRTIATDYAVHQILHDGFAGEISDLTRFYVLWRWEYGEARAPFDEARKLAQSCGLDVSREWGRGGFIKKDKEFIQVLGPQARKLEALTTSHEMIDVLHRVLLLWEQGKRTEMVSALAASGYGASEAFYRVAQAISETLPNESKEKKLLDGFLAGRGRVRDEVEQIVHRPTLWQE